MSEVSTRPQTGKTKASKAVPAAQQAVAEVATTEATQHPEWLALALPHVRKLSDFIYTLIGCSEDQKAPELIQSLVEEADAVLRESCDVECGRGYTNSHLLWSDLGTVVLLLRSASYACEHGPLNHDRLMTHATIIDAAVTYASGLYDALHAAPQDLSRLEALDGDAYMRMRPKERRQIFAAAARAKQTPPPASTNPEHIYHASDVDLVFSNIATQSLVLRDFLIDARVTLESEGGVTRAVNNMMVGENLACLLGSVAEQMCQVQTIGPSANWTTGTAISRIGGAE